MTRAGPAHIDDGERLASGCFLVRRPDPTVSLGIFDWVVAQGGESCHRDFPGSNCGRDACAAVEIETAAPSKSLVMALRKRMSARYFFRRHQARRWAFAG